MRELSEVHMFSAAGIAAPGNQLYPVGEKRELLLFLGQLPGTDHDWEAAKTVLLEAGWKDMSFDRATITTQDLSSIADQTLRDAIMHAAQGDSSILVYGSRQKRDK